MSDRDALAEVAAWLTEQCMVDHAWRCEYPDIYGPCVCAVVDAESVLASDWLASVKAKAAARALEDFADTRGVNVGDEDSDWWGGYRQAQRECLHAAAARAADLRDGGEE